MIVPSLCFRIVHLVSFTMLIFFAGDDPQEFFFTLSLVVFFLFRQRVKNSDWSLLLDSTLLIILGNSMPFVLFIIGSCLILFQVIFAGYYFSLLFVFYPLLIKEHSFFIYVLFSAGCGQLLRLWQCERNQRFVAANEAAKSFQEHLKLQQELQFALKEVEQMTAVMERARIARDLHDNAGHAIIGAYISFQTIRPLLRFEDPEIGELYDTALSHLSDGVEKLREGVHNISTVNRLGIDRLTEICDDFSFCPITFIASGDSTKVSSNAWQTLESCLNEGLKNIVKHSAAKKITVELDITPYIVRLSIENDGIVSKDPSPGIGLRNLRYRLNAIGGHFAVDSQETFKVIAIIPILQVADGKIRKEESHNETTDC
ncbi:histidine kinase [Enterococcus casseliflavus]